MNDRYSVIIPARNEERYIGACLASTDRARTYAGCDAEVIVVINRCTDSTEDIARESGARIVREDGKNLARIRNAGAAEAAGDVIVTIDADSWMSENMFTEIDRALKSGRYIGGGVRIVPERMSPGVWVTTVMLKTFIRLAGLTGGLYWCRREDFEAVGGFNDNLLFGEDLDFAKRLRAHGRTKGLRLTTLRDAYIETSCRKLDRFGDWCIFKEMFLRPVKLIQGFRGKDRSFADRFFYDFER
jgi:glycosyltransferase involved in cell wall biosynthesis